MTFSKPANGVVFADKKEEDAFNELEEGDWLKEAIRKAIKDIKENAVCGENIKKKQIPKEYIKKYNIDNLWWYPLPNAWRLLYSIITPSNVELLAVIIDYSSRKDYERTFGYK